MLEELHIAGLGVIADATLELGPGLTVVTGETGAGKTMVVAGLGLLFGGRADAGRVRTGSAQALVEGRLRVPAGGGAALRALEAGAEPDEDGTLLAGRTVSAHGRSRAHLGGRSIPVGLLGELGEELLTVHGQTDQLRLLRPAEQRAALDRFAGPAVADLLAVHRRHFERWQAVERELAERSSAAREHGREVDEMRRAVADIATVAPRPGEDAALRAEAQRLDHADALRAAAGGAVAALVSDATAEADATSLLGAARRALEQVAGHDPALDELRGRVTELGYLAADVAGDLASYADSVDTDPGRLAQLHDRRAALQRLLRTHADRTAAPDPAGDHVTDPVGRLLAWAAGAVARLDELDTSGERLARLEAERAELAAAVTDAAGALSRARAGAAAEFSAAVTAELGDLALPHAAVEARLTRRPATAGAPSVTVDGALVAVGPDGIDDVELEFVGHAGAPARPLRQAASGGELSRVMLAVEVVFAAADQVPTLVFDEVDAGVGGRAAVEVGRRLARLAGTHQVLAVTHLPQVAAFADRHLVVAKDDDGSVTASGVREVAGPDRVRELARMLAGLDHSDTGLAHAQELLLTAQGQTSVGRPRSAGSMRH